MSTDLRAAQTEAHKVRSDKAQWGDGPWQSEPDRVDFVHAGYVCLIRRGPVGALCGYVGVDESHPFFGKGYDDVDDLAVHGGLTYANECAGEICHVPEPGMPDHVWWLGFDCSHAGDVAPAMQAFERKMHEETGADVWKRLPFENEHETYRTLEYVRAQTESLAEQLRAISPSSPSSHTSKVPLQSQEPAS